MVDSQAFYTKIHKIHRTLNTCASVQNKYVYKDNMPVCINKQQQQFTNNKRTIQGPTSQPREQDLTNIFKLCGPCHPPSTTEEVTTSRIFHYSLPRRSYYFTTCMYIPTEYAI